MGIAEIALVQRDPMPNISLQCHTNNKGTISRNVGQVYEANQFNIQIRGLNLQIVLQIIPCKAVGYLWRCFRGKKCSCSVELELLHFYHLRRKNCISVRSHL